MDILRSTRKFLDRAAVAAGGCSYRYDRVRLFLLCFHSVLADLSTGESSLQA